MEKLESVQYSAALAVTGTCRGTSRERLYTELCLESLSSRRWSRRLTLFYKIVNDLTPVYTKDPIPPLHQSQYSLCGQDVIGRLRARTEKFKSSFYPNCLYISVRGGGAGCGSPPTLEKCSKISLFRANFCP